MAIGGAAYGLYAYSVFEGTEAMLAAAILFVAAAQIPGWLGAAARRLRKPGELSDLIKANATLSKNMQILNRRMDTLNGAPDNTGPSVDLERMVEKIGEIEERLTSMSRTLESKPSLPAAQPATASLQQRSAQVRPPSSFAMTATPSLVATAVARSDAALFLQPIVNLASRKTNAYEATLKLVGPNGKPFDAAVVEEIIRSKDLELKLDRILLEKAIRVATHFRNRGRETPVICRFSDRSFVNAEFLDYLLNTLTTRKYLAGAILPAISQGDLALLSTQALEVLAGLNDQGFRFVMDDLRDMEAKPDIFRRAGFSMVRAPAEFFSRSSPERDAECLALLGKFRQADVLAFAQDVAREQDIENLLNGVDSAQGDIFSCPRMVRAELSEGGTNTVSAQAS